MGWMVRNVTSPPGPLSTRRRGGVKGITQPIELLRAVVIILVISFVGQNVHIVQSQTEVEARVLPDQLKVREWAGYDAPTIGSYPRGAVLRITGWDGTVWVFAIPVQGAASDLTGWVHWDYVDFPAGFDVGTLPISNATGTAGSGAAAANDSGAGGDVASSDAGEVPVPSLANGQLAGTTLDAVNFRAGPDTSYATLRTLPGNTSVILIGRNSAASWVQAVVDGQEGWLYAPLVEIAGDVTTLPDSGATTSPDAGASTSPAAPGIPSGVIPSVGGRAREIFLAGQARSNRANAFAKVGDSITDMPMFLYPLAGGQYDLGEYAYLQPVITQFAGSFGRVSAAARGGWTTNDLLDPGKNFQGFCNAGESPLVCEYRTHQPAVALIMIGTNDAEFEVAGGDYRANLETIVQTTIDMGVIPVLSTIPDNARNAAANGRVQDYNAIIRSVAGAYGVPLWDYWSALQGLPNKGLSSDGIHPSFDSAPGTAGLFTPDHLGYGFNMRNLTALMVLQAVWGGAMY